MKRISEKASEQFRNKRKDEHKSVEFNTVQQAFQSFKTVVAAPFLSRPAWSEYLTALLVRESLAVYLALGVIHHSRRSFVRGQGSRGGRGVGDPTARGVLTHCSQVD